MILTILFVLAGITGPLARIMIGQLSRGSVRAAVRETFGALLARTITDALWGAGLGLVGSIVLPYLIVPLATMLAPGVQLPAEQFRTAPPEVKVTLMFFISYCFSHAIAAKAHKATAVDGNGHDAPPKES